MQVILKHKHKPTHPSKYQLHAADTLDVFLVHSLLLPCDALCHSFYSFDKTSLCGL